MAIDKRVEICLLSTFFVLLSLIGLIIYLVTWILFKIGLVAYYYPQQAGAVALVVAAYILYKRIRWYLLMRALSKPSEKELKPKIDVEALRIEMKKIEQRIERNIARNAKLEKLLKPYRMPKHLRKMVQKIDKEYRRVKETSRRRREIFYRNMQDCSETLVRDKIELSKIRSVHETNEELNQEFRAHFAKFTENAAKRRQEELRNFVAGRKRRCPPLCDKQNTYYPYPCTFEMLQDSLCKVDEAYKTFKLDINLIMMNRFKGVLVNFTCVLSDMLETDQAKMALGQLDADDDIIYDYNLQVDRKKKSWKKKRRFRFKFTDINFIISMTHSQIMFFRQRTVKFLEQINNSAKSRNTDFDTKYFIEMQDLLSKVRDHSLQEIYTHIDKVSTIKLNNALEAKKQKQLNEHGQEDSKDSADEILEHFTPKTDQLPTNESEQQSTEETCLQSTDGIDQQSLECSVKTAKVEDDEQEDCTIVIDLTDEPQRRWHRIPSQREKDEKLYFAVGCFGIGVATLFAVRYFLKR